MFLDGRFDPVIGEIPAETARSSRSGAERSLPETGIGNVTLLGAAPRVITERLLHDETIGPATAPDTPRVELADRRCTERARPAVMTARSGPRECMVARRKRNRGNIRITDG